MTTISSQTYFPYIFPDEILQLIIAQLDYNSYHVFCRVTTRLQLLFTTNPGIILIGVRLRLFHAREEFKQRGIYVLDKLGMIYSTGYENIDDISEWEIDLYNLPNGAGTAGVCVEYARTMREYLLNDAFHYHYQVVKPAVYDYTKPRGTNRLVKAHQIITSKDELKDDDYDLQITYSATETLLNEFNITVPYKLVVIKFNDPTYWITTPTDEWYQMKHYMSVVNKFMEVHVSAEKKGTAITLEDILYATRGLAIDDTRPMNRGTGYKILEEDDDKLVIEPDIDNYST